MQRPCWYKEWDACHGPLKSLFRLLFSGESCLCERSRGDQRPAQNYRGESSRDGGHDQCGSSHKCSHSRHVKDYPTSRCPRTISEEKTDSTNGES